MDKENGADDREIGSASNTAHFEDSVPPISLPPVNVEKLTARNLFQLYINTFLGSSFAESWVYPLDVTKTRMQLEHEEAKKTGAKVKNMFTTMYGVGRNEGIKSLYSGLSAMIIRNLLFNSLRVVFYDIIRRQLIYHNEEGKEVLTVAHAFFGGSVAGCMAQFLANPFDIVKVRMQMEGRRRLQGLPTRVHNVGQAFRDIYKEGGISSMWRGVSPSCLRACLMTAGDVGSYDLSKRNFRKYLQLDDGLVLQLLSSLSAGLVASILSNPADVIKSRVMNQPVDEKGRGLNYKNSADCFIKLIKEENVLALYKGLIPCWLRLGPWSVIFWLSLEKLREWEGQSGF
ncbi:mitochondrial uncoupling protein 4C [Scaptodrosophila lebanonensis]|uniref:Mitochondrial uncoupling protein 4C n=1 Tax=Drosophila lebanonensis TaxID=7225 RepID=A0A6J2TR87_DROLE|nr:mitochondrial uncoupling protein 4C [Scaptodrosophila lebanonensis]